MIETRKSTALFIGRFQPFHNGHLYVLRKLSNLFKKVIIGIGSAQYSHTLENPFTSGERFQMISQVLERTHLKNCIIVPIEDLGIHSLWVQHVVSLVPEFELVFSNDPLTRRLFIEKGYKVESIPFYKRREYSGTEIRKRMLEGKKWEHLVPKEVAMLIKAAQAERRLKDLILKRI